MTTDPTPDRRARIVAAIKSSPFEELRTVDHASNGPLQITVRVDYLADTLLRALAAEPDDTDLTESAIDRMVAAGVPVQIVTAPPDTYAPGRIRVSRGDAETFYEPDEDSASLRARFETAEKGVTAPPAASVPAGRDALRDRIAEALANADGWKWADGFKEHSPTWHEYQHRADAVVAVLPPPADQAAEEAYRLALSTALRLGTGANWEAIRDRAEDLVAEVTELTEARRLQQPAADRAAGLREAAEDLATAFGDPTAKHIGILGASYLRRRAREAEAAQTAEAQTEAEPETPLEKRLRYSERRNDELREECLRRGKRVLEQSEKAIALEKQLDEVRTQLGAEILRAGRAEGALDAFQRVARRLANHAVGFQDVLDDSDREPWAKTVGADIAELRRLADCHECSTGAPHTVHCPTPETHNWGCGCPSDVAAAIASCPGAELSPNPCRCPCYGRKHHCGAHDASRMAAEAQQQTETPAVAYRSPGTRALYCVVCARQETGWQPVTEVEDGAVCDFCGGGVLAVASRTLGDVVARYLPAVVAAVAGEEPDTETGGDRPSVLCNRSVLRQPHVPHQWQPQPGMDWIDCPGLSGWEMPDDDHSCAESGCTGELGPAASQPGKEG